MGHLSVVQCSLPEGYGFFSRTEKLTLPLHRNIKCTGMIDEYGTVKGSHCKEKNNCIYFEMTTDNHSITQEF
jgi:hypothetical protein